MVHAEEVRSAQPESTHEFRLTTSKYSMIIIEHQPFHHAMARSVATPQQSLVLPEVKQPPARVRDTQTQGMLSRYKSAATMPAAATVIP